MRLYDYFRSTAAYRVRIVLNLKGLDYESVPVNLLQGEEFEPAYRAINPQGLVPALEVDGHHLSQSLAICEYLEERYPQPSILPTELIARARCRSLAQVVACDIHPVNNLRILGYLTGTLGISEEQKLEWYRHWVSEGLVALEQMLQNAPDRGNFCIGQSPTLADICLVPQLFNARRFECDLKLLPTLLEIEQHCLSLAAFDRARPENQADAQ